MMSLAAAPMGREMYIKKCIAPDEKTKRHLENMGLVAGAAILPVFEASGDVIVKIKGSKLAINKELARKIFVIDLPA